MKPKPEIKVTRYDKAMANRFVELRKNHLNQTQKECAEALGLPQSRLSYIEGAVQGISPELIKKLEHLYNINPKWLLIGEKPVFKNKKEKSNTIIDVSAINDRIDKLVKEVIILNKNLDRAYELISNQQKEIDRLTKEQLIR